VTEISDYDDVPSSELHDRAFALAEKRHDIGFFWRLLKAIPEAEAVSGSPEETTTDVWHVSAWIGDFLAPRELDDALRPIYVDYLVKHEK
jgi:hypothetical protein